MSKLEDAHDAEKPVCNGAEGGQVLAIIAISYWIVKVLTKASASGMSHKDKFYSIHLILTQTETNMKGCKRIEDAI